MDPFETCRGLDEPRRCICWVDNYPDQLSLQDTGIGLAVRGGWKLWVVSISMDGLIVCLSERLEGVKKADVFKGRSCSSWQAIGAGVDRKLINGDGWNYSECVARYIAVPVRLLLDLAVSFGRSLLSTEAKR